MNNKKGKGKIAKSVLLKPVKGKCPVCGQQKVRPYSWGIPMPFTVCGNVKCRKYGT